jgi:flavin-dependent dehydrogenase
VNVDVVIIGGGPAGCSSALSLIARGRSVAIISTQNRREKPTETSAPKLKQLLRLLDAEEALSACEPCFGIVSDWGRKAPVLRPGMVSPFGHAWFVHRARFDSCLQQMARDRGMLWVQTEAKVVKFNSKGVLVETIGQPIQARWLIVATGSPSWTANITGQQLVNIDSLVALWAHLPLTQAEKVLSIETTDYGWWYACPGDGAGIFVCCVTDSLGARATGVQQISSWNEKFQGINLYQKLGGASAETINIISASTASLPRKFGQSWIAVGDAAVKLDPLGSSGLATALDSGRRAGQAVADALLDNITSLENYVCWSAGLVAEFVRQRQQHYAIESSKRMSGFWSRRNESSCLT